MPIPQMGHTIGHTALKNCSLEGKRMASGDIGNVVPGNRLRVRPPCPPLRSSNTLLLLLLASKWAASGAVALWPVFAFAPSRVRGNKTFFIQEGLLDSLSAGLWLHDFV